MAENSIDARSIAKMSTGTMFLGAIGVAAFIYLLPWLDKIAWTGVHLILGLAAGGLLLMVLTNPKFWRNMKAINEKIAKLFTFWIIEWDEFLLQEMEIDQAKLDREDIKKQASILHGQVSVKDEELSDAQYKLKEAKGLVKELQGQGKTDDDTEIQLYANDVIRNEDFINTISPLRDQIDDLATMLDRVYKDTSLKIRDAENELKIQKIKFESLTAGETAMNKALSIFTSDNADVALAKATVKRKIGEKIGSIRTTLDIIKPMMDERSLKDKVKVKLALEQMKTVNVDNVFVPVNIKFQPKQFNNLLK